MKSMLHSVRLLHLTGHLQQRGALVGRGQQPPHALQGGHLLRDLRLELGDRALQVLLQQLELAHSVLVGVRLEALLACSIAPVFELIQQAFEDKEISASDCMEASMR